MHHNPCFNLFILHNSQGSEIKKRHIFTLYCLLRKLSSYYQRKYYYIPTTKKVFVKDSKSKRKKNHIKQILKFYIPYKIFKKRFEQGVMKFCKFQYLPQMAHIYVIVNLYAFYMNVTKYFKFHHF